MGGGVFNSRARNPSFLDCSLHGLNLNGKFKSR